MRRLAPLIALLLATIVTGGAHRVAAEPVNVTPVRLLDTREGFGAPRGQLQPGVTLTLVVPGIGGATSATLNLPATEASAGGFVTAWPCAQSKPATSNLNVVPGHTDANLVTVGLSNGNVCIAASVPVHLVVDLMGGFTGSGDFRSAAPTRVLDTRAPARRFALGEERRIPLGSGAGFTSSARSVAMNVTVIDPAAAGFVVAYPCGNRPLASTVNFTAREIVPNFTIVPFTNSEICVYASQPTDLVIDTFGWSDNNSGLRSQSPSRVLDTRTGDGWLGGPVNAADTIELGIAGAAGVPNNAGSALVTITATGGAADGFITMWPCDKPRPVTSVLNLRSGLLRSNLALVPLSSVNGSLCIYAQTSDASRVHLVADVVGWTTGGPARTPAKIFTDTFPDLSNWSAMANWSVQDQSSQSPGSSASVQAGAARIVAADQNYGDAFIRANARYTLQTGTTAFKLDVDLGSGAQGGDSTLLGWPILRFTSIPYGTATTFAGNGKGPTPATGVLVRFVNNCRVAWAPPSVVTWTNHNETLSDDTDNCDQVPTTQPGKLNRVEVRYTPGTISIWASDFSANGTSFGPLKHVADYPGTIPSSGYVTIGAHNHATLKYSNGSMATIDALFDNVSYPTAGLSRSYRNGINVDPTGATNAYVSFSAYNSASVNNPTVVVNGHAHSISPTESQSRSYAEAFAIPVSDLVAGNNTISITGFSVVGNIDLVVEY